MSDGHEFNCDAVVDAKSYEKWLNEQNGLVRGRMEELPPRSDTLQFEIIGLVCHASFANVGLAERIGVAGGREKFAVKTFSMQRVHEKFLTDYVMDERLVLASVNHPFITRLIDRCMDENTLYMVMPYMPFTLFSLADQHQNRRLSLALTRFYASELYLAIVYLQKIRVLHRDLSPDNILVGRDGHLRVAGFTRCKVFKDNQDHTCTKAGTSAYMAPEVLRGNYAFPIHWWMLGCLVYEMLVGKEAFGVSCGLIEIAKAIMEQAIEFPEDMDENAKDLVTRLCAKNPKDRLGCGQDGPSAIENHEFFKGVNFVDVFCRRQKAPELPEPRSMIKWNNEPAPDDVKEKFKEF